ncbi:MAG: hypothetical protein AB8B79_20625 [Granulosicoccus sp.]
MKSVLKSPEVTDTALWCEVQDTARGYAHRSRSHSTWRPYLSACKLFKTYFHSMGLPSLPAADTGTVAMPASKIDEK